MEKYFGRSAASWPMTAGSLATPSGVRGGNNSKEKLRGKVMRGTPREGLKNEVRKFILAPFLPMRSQSIYSEMIPILPSHVSTNSGHLVTGSFVRRSPKA